MTIAEEPDRIVNATAPIRVCDNGGWTDTWFARHGRVFNIGVQPCVEVRLAVHQRGILSDRIVLDARSFGDRYGFTPGAPPGRHPLLEAAVEEMGVPDNVSLEIAISSEAPAGCSTGTSASVAVALLAALDSLTPGRMTPHDLAYSAHRIEVNRLGAQSGIQDQLCAAYGGINYIEIDDYPNASVSQLSLPDAVRSELDRSLVLVYLGRPHTSSAVHDQVIAELARVDGKAPELELLRRCAEEARDSLCAGDLGALGRSMITNTEAQRALSPRLVSEKAQAAIDVASAHKALGWRVNGAGGEGGSITILCGPDPPATRRLLRALPSADPLFQVVPIQLSSDGVRVREELRS